MRGIGIAAKGKKLFLFYEAPDKNGKAFHVASSADGFHFEPFSAKPTIVGASGKKEDIAQCKDFRIAEARGKYFLTYKVKARTKTSVAVATSSDLMRWRAHAKLGNILETGMVVPEHTHEGRYVMYFGEKSLRAAFSKDLKSWRVEQKPILAPRKNSFDKGSLILAGVVNAAEGIVVLYYSKSKHGTRMLYTIGSALFAKHDPTKLLWRSEVPLWDQADGWRDKKIYPIGVVDFKRTALFYWGWEDGMFAIAAPFLGRAEVFHEIAVKPRLGKFHKNPIIVPRAEHHWESRATFNPAALYEGGKVHLLYRAIGDADVSVLGYASSTNGVEIRERLNEPAYIPREAFEGVKGKPVTFAPSYSPFASGGGCSGGCEDPRLMKIGNRVYMTYVAYDGWSAPRVALTHISIDDFLNRRWNWSRPVLISPPGVIDKNACILPEKVGGKYVVFHRVFPDIQIDFVDNLEFDGKTKWLKPKGDAAIHPRRKPFWDSRKIGIGAPPIKTKDGWLLVYQGVGDQDPGRYKIGAMLLDLKDPTRVLHRSRHPVLEPSDAYENEGHKGGVVYPCGAVVIRDRLFVYYGGADTVVCVATAPLKEFVEDLTMHEEAKLEPVVFGEVSPIIYDYH